MRRLGKHDPRSAVIALGLIAAALACARANVDGGPPDGAGIPGATATPATAVVAPPTLAAQESPTPPDDGALPTAATAEVTATVVPDVPGPSTKLMPDSEVVYGPSAATFDLFNFVLSQGGYLSRYTEKVSDEELSGSSIVRLVALNYSINPRLLLALLENQTGWVTNPDPRKDSRTYPLARREAGREGLYRQLTWAADTLNRGYYGWREAKLGTITFSDQRVVLDQGLNAGTVALQYFLSQYYGSGQSWLAELGSQGFSGTYTRLFGDPFASAVEPLVPPDLIQLPLSWPWDPTETWYFLGGPHGAYDAGSAWAALDFAPPGPPSGCAPVSAWERAAAPGVIARSDHGVVALDLDYGTSASFDGYEQTGWVLFYLHVDPRDRVTVGQIVNTGDPIGHPGCEGGAARGAALHLARKYNGEWIPAVGPPAFDIAGWTPTGGTVEYAGDLVGGDYTLTACECRSSVNAIKGEGR